MGAWKNGVYLGRIMHVHSEENGMAFVTIRSLGTKDFQTWISVDDAREM